MQQLVEGFRKFRRQVFPDYRNLFANLARGQTPQAMLITCSDSRIDPGLITQCLPGDLFVLRTAGNLVPPYGESPSSEAATIEFAVRVLRVGHVIVCGHSRCGAIDGLLHPQSMEQLPAVRSWLQHAAPPAQAIRDEYAHLRNDEGALLSAAVRSNVLVQLEHLRTHPAVADAIGRREMELHGWVYEFESADIFAYSAEREEFVPLSDTVPAER